MTFPFTVAITNSESLESPGGVSRVLRELLQRWQASVLYEVARFTSLPLPIVRDYPYGLKVPPGVNVVYLPRTGGAFALRQLGIPSVVTVHDVGFWDCPADVQALGWKRELILPHFRGLRYASLVAVDSEFTGARLKALIPDLASKIRVVHLGVSRVFSDWSMTREESLRAVRIYIPGICGSPLVIYAGDDAPRKNLPLLLRVFRQVKQAYPEAQLIKVGPAKLAQDRRRTLQTLRDLKLIVGQDVLFLDKVDDPLLAALYTACDVFVSASLYEGFGLPPIEAMATGTPAVVTNCGAFPEIVGGAAILAEPEEQSMSSAILSLLNQSSQSPSSDELKRFARRYSWDKAAQQYLNLFYEVTKSRDADLLASQSQ